MTTRAAAAASKTGQRPIDRFRDASGMFTMVAIDQRGSLRHMYLTGQGLTEVSDAQLRSFKREVANEVTPAASGILLDRQLGADAAKAASCPVILAADILSSSVPGEPVDLAELDDAVTAEVVGDFGAQALKMLVPWLPGTRNAAIDLAGRFMERCRELELPGVVEGVIRPRDTTMDDHEYSEALVEAARDFALVEPDLYKTEIGFQHEDDNLVTAAARAITDAINSPWVVLSSGVSADRFPAAAAAACKGGASGFLAGRAIWAAALQASNPAEYLRAHSRQAMTSLADKVRGLDR
ncbi:UNVERIFIED_ORG: sulfofructosephosphate aldolase [Arthrobacter globiformis]|nr:sulfofructosephosphate aldolase [Arthrobacter globiformis]